MKYIVSSLIILFTAINSFADSPLTSTPFYNAYMDVAEVKSANESGFSKNHMKFLSDETVSMDKKLAVINALSWGDSAHVYAFQDYLLAKYKGLDKEVFNDLRYTTYESLPPVDAAPHMNMDELVSWAYLDIMADYFHPARGWNAVIIALQQDEENAAYGLVLDLIRCQHTMDSFVWCDVYLEHETFKLRGDTKDAINEDAMAIIDEYIGLYKQDCSETDLKQWRAQNGIAEVETFEVSGTITVNDAPVWIEDSTTVKTKDGYFKNQELSGKEKVDLEIVEIYMPDWISNDEFRGSEITVKIKNKGNVASVECVGLLEENKLDAMEQGTGWDMYKAAVTVIKPLEPGEEYELKFRIDEHWVYDPNCEIEITIDYLNQIKEKNEKNNKERFEEYG